VTRAIGSSLLALELMFWKSGGSYPLPPDFSSFFVLVWPQASVTEPTHAGTAIGFDGDSVHCTGTSIFAFRGAD
jgi:hypothetical protein